METTLKEKWLEISGRKNTLLCAGLDAADFRINGVVRSDYAKDYIGAIAPHCAAVIVDGQLCRSANGGDYNALRDIINFAHKQELLVIDDSKLTNIGSVNGADAVTFSPFLGNLEEAVEQAHKRGIGLIPICLAGNPEFLREKNMLITVPEEDYESYGLEDMATDDYKRIGDDIYVRQYIQLAHDAHKFGADGIVVGALSQNGHPAEAEGELKELRNVAGYYKNGLVLVPDARAYGGNVESLFKTFNHQNLIVGIKKDGAGHNQIATLAQQVDSARQFRDMLNSFRKKQAI